MTAEEENIGCAKRWYVDGLDSDGNTALVYALIRRDSENVAIILEVGACVNVTANGISALSSVVKANPSCFREFRKEAAKDTMSVIRGVPL